MKKRSILLAGMIMLFMIIFAEAGLAEETIEVTGQFDPETCTATVEWEPVADAKKYEVRVENQYGNKKPSLQGTFVQVQSSMTTTETKKTIPSTYFTTWWYGETNVYRIRVTAYRYDTFAQEYVVCATGYSSIFSTEMERLGTTSNIKIYTGNTSESRNAGVVEWKEVPNATCYKISVDASKNKATSGSNFRENVVQLYRTAGSYYELSYVCDISNYIEYTATENVWYRVRIIAMDNQNKDYIDGEEVVSDWFQFNTLPTKKITSVVAPPTINAPSLGLSPDYLTKNYQSPNEHYTITGNSWMRVEADGNGGLDGDLLKKDYKFKNGENYVVILDVKPHEGYEFSEVGVMTGACDGGEFLGYMLDPVSKKQQFYYIYPAIETKEIHQLNLTAEWNLGCTGLKNVSVTGKIEDNGLKKTTASVIKTEYVYFGKVISEVESNENVAVRITVEPKLGYGFATDCTVTLKIGSLTWNANLVNDGNGKYYFTVSPVTVPQPDLPIPENLTVVHALSGKPELSWSPVESAVGYVIYRTTPLAGGIKSTLKAKVAEVYDCTYTDTNANPGTTYCYYVCGLYPDSTGLHEGTGAVSERIFCTPAIPSVEKLTNSWYGVTVKWKPVSGYAVTVYRKAENESSWKALTTTTAGGYYDKTAVNNTTYSYALAWVKNSTTTRPGEVTGVLYMVPPAIEAVTNISGGVKVTWSAVPGADGYFVYRKDTQEGTWHMIGSTQKNLYFNDKTTESGTVYYYAIKSFKKVGTETVTSASSSAKNTIYVKNTFISKLSNQYSGTLKVEFSQTPNCSGYEIEYSTSADMKNPVPVLVKMASAKDKSIINLTKGKTYYVRIRSYKTMGGYTFYSNWSAVKSLTLTK